MAPKKQKVAATAPASQRRLGSKKAGVPTRAEKSKTNSASHTRATKEAREFANATIEAGRKLGQTAVGVPYEPAHERYWRKPLVEWSEELEEDLFILMSTGHGMNAISKMEGMPSVMQMMRWLADKDHAFTICRARAQAHLIPFYEELAKDIALSSNSFSIKTTRQVVTKDGDVVDVVEERFIDNVERSKLAVATLQWTLSHLMPKKHGRQPDTGDNQKNEQLEGLFAALKAGPAS